MSTTAILDEAARKKLADEGEQMIAELVKRMDMPHVVKQMRRLEDYNHGVETTHPWMPSAYNRQK